MVSRLVMYNHYADEFDSDLKLELLAEHIGYVGYVFFGSLRGLMNAMKYIDLLDARKDAIFHSRLDTT